MRWILTTLLIMLITAAAQAQTIQLYAAGSLRAALTEIVRYILAEKAQAIVLRRGFGPGGPPR